MIISTPVMELSRIAWYSRYPILCWVCNEFIYSNFEVPSGSKIVMHFSDSHMKESVCVEMIKYVDYVSGLSHVTWKNVGTTGFRTLYPNLGKILRPMVRNTKNPKKIYVQVEIV